MKFSGTILVVLAAMLWGISGGLADILLHKGWSPLVISFYRGAVGFVCIFAWFLLRLRKTGSPTVRLFVWAGLAGAGVAGNFTFYFLSIEASSVAIAATLMYTAPIFVFLISFFLRQEASTFFKWGCIAVVLVGIFLLTGAYDTGGSTVTLAGAAAGLGAGLSYALFIFGFKYASAAGRPETILTIAFFIFCVLLLLFIDRQEAASVLASSDVGWFLLLGLVGAGISFVLYIIGIKRTTPVTASMVAMAEPVTASLFGVVLLGDSLTIIQAAGIAIILLSITAFSVRQSA
ncbi:EamA family transporter [Marinococcus halophilus]|uniref:EamA family transporter n=1 Tax=Marinococcus halophilus TaxID=1371 RepID=A0A510Y896_MARHA|nr:EamA family transporter [Marinococcus halophilus]OZT79350.1 EamA family transporter [Marinococcus halophilus]GEK59600.1 EamA family transporter [Marinococcus halophilus]